MIFFFLQSALEFIYLGREKIIKDREKSEIEFFTISFPFQIFSELHFLDISHYFVFGSTF